MTAAPWPSGSGVEALVVERQQLDEASGSQGGPTFQEAIIKVESAGPVPSDPEGFAAIDQAYNFSYDPGCSASDVPDSWFDLLVLGGG